MFRPNGEQSSLSTVRQYASLSTVRQYASLPVRQYASLSTVRQYASLSTVRQYASMPVCPQYASTPVRQYASMPAVIEAQSEAETSKRTNQTKGSKAAAMRCATYGVHAVWRTLSHGRMRSVCHSVLCSAHGARCHARMHLAIVPQSVPVHGLLYGVGQS